MLGEALQRHEEHPVAARQRRHMHAVPGFVRHRLVQFDRLRGAAAAGAFDGAEQHRAAPADIEHLPDRDAGELDVGSPVAMDDHRAAVEQQAGIGQRIGEAADQACLLL